MSRGLVVREILCCAGARLAALLRCTRSAAISRSALAVGRGALAARRPFARLAGGRFGPFGGARIAVASPRPVPVRHGAGRWRVLPCRCPMIVRATREPQSRRVAANTRAKVQCRALLEPRRYCIDRHEWPNLVGENPRVYVSWFQAKELCWNVGKRLCRRSEWMLACEGPKRCLSLWVREATEPVQHRSKFDSVRHRRHDQSRNARGRALSLWQADPIGSHPACVSPLGAFDMTGNVDEWTDNQGDDPTTQEVSTLNGGYWGPVSDTVGSPPRRMVRRSAFTKSGFAAAPMPATESRARPS